MTFTASITKRHRRRRLKSGIIATQTRYVVNCVDPSTGRRAQLFFERHSDAVTKRNQLLNSVATGVHTRKHAEKTVAQAVEHSLENRQGEVKDGTWRSYKHIASYVVGPLLAGTKAERRKAARKRVAVADGVLPGDVGPEVHLQVGNSRHSQLASDGFCARQRLYGKCSAQVFAGGSGPRSRRLSPAHSRDAISAWPRQTKNSKKAILTTDQIAILVSAALRENERGIYYIFPFLTGLRPSEQLALLWDDVDMDAGVIRVKRMQEQDCSITA